MSEVDGRFQFRDKSRIVFANEHAAVREACRAAAEVVDRTVPDGREKSLALTKLEEATFWANAGIARALP
jgi:uncharacterized protein DUF6894